MEKCDNLFLIIGSNPMPNLIAISNRLRNGGKLFLIVSEENNNDKNQYDTKSIADKITECLNEKKIGFYVETIEVDKNREDSILGKVEKICSDNKLFDSTELKTITELNYTGGTKLMSSTLYKFFKCELKKNKNLIVLSYFDIVDSKFIIETNENQQESYYEVEGDKELYDKMFNLKDIILIHEINKFTESNISQINEDSRNFGDNIGNMTDKEFVEFVNRMDKVNSKDINYTLDLIEDYVSKNVRNGYESDFKCLGEKPSKKKLGYFKKKIVRYINGDALEEYFCLLFKELEDEKIIDEFLWSVKPEYNNNIETEIDIFIRKGYKNALVSLTLCNEEHEVLPKLYEAIARGEQFAGDECNVLYVCLYNDKKKLIGKVEKYENRLRSKINIFSRYDFNNMYENLKKWCEEIK